MNRHVHHIRPITEAVHAALHRHDLGSVPNKVEVNHLITHPFLTAAYALADEGTPEAMRDGHDRFARLLLTAREVVKHFDSMAPGADPLATSFIAFVDGVLPEPK